MRLHWDFDVQDIQTPDLKVFKGRTDQFIFISSALPRQKTASKLSSLRQLLKFNNPFWKYSRDKIECEDALMDASTAPRDFLSPSSVLALLTDHRNPILVGSWTTSLDR